MSKSAGNTIPIFAEPDEIRKIVMNMVTDPQRIKRTDPGRPEVCNVCQLHRFFGGDYLQIQDGERTARTGCVDTKELLADRIIEFFRPMREKRMELAADPDVVERVLAAGAAKVRPILEATLAEVRAATGIGPQEPGADDGRGPAGRPGSPRATLAARLPGPGIGLLRGAADPDGVRLPGGLQPDHPDRLPGLAAGLRHVAGRPLPRGAAAAEPRRWRW